MAGLSSVVIRIGAQTADAVREISNVDKALGKTQTSGQKLQAGLQKAAIPAAAALTALGAAALSSVKAAAAAEKSRSLLDEQVKRSTGATEDAIKANEDWVSSMSRMAAVSAGEIRPALAGLVRATGDVTKAHQLMREALDTSAATGKPLATVAAALGKAYNGSNGALTRLVPSLTKAAAAGKGFADVQKELNAQVGGAAAKEAQTTAGQYKEMQIQLAALQVTIGNALLPALQAMLPIAQKVLGTLAGHPDAIIALAGAIGTVSAAVLAANAALKIYSATMLIYANRQKLVAAASKAWAVAQWLLNAALDANPIGAIIVGLVALGAALVIAYKHSATFRAIVNGAFQAVESAARQAWGAIQAIAGAIAGLARKDPAIQAVIALMGELERAVNAVIDAIEKLIGWIGHIHFPSKPSWLPLAVPAGIGAPIPLGPSTMAAPAPMVNVTIQGAIDPEQTAIAIRRVLNRYDRRRGLRPLGGAGMDAPT